VTCPCHVAAGHRLVPKGMPERFCGPFHGTFVGERRTLPAPVDPGFLPRRSVPCDARYFGVPRGGEAFPLFAKATRRRGAKTGPGPARRQTRGSRDGLGRAGHGSVEVGNGLQGARSWATRACTRRVEGRSRLHPWSAARVLMPQWGRVTVRPCAVVHGKSSPGWRDGRVGRLSGWPAAEEVAKDRRIFFLKHCRTWGK